MTIKKKIFWKFIFKTQRHGFTSFYQNVVFLTVNGYYFVSWLMHPMTWRLTLNGLQKVWWSDVTQSNKMAWRNLVEFMCKSTFMLTHCHKSVAAWVLQLFKVFTNADCRENGESRFWRICPPLWSNKIVQLQLLCDSSLCMQFQLLCKSMQIDFMQFQILSKSIRFDYLGFKIVFESTWIHLQFDSRPRFA